LRSRPCYNEESNACLFIQGVPIIQRLEQTPWNWTGETPVGQLLAAERERLGLSQSELARRLGVSGANLSRIERGADLRVSTLLDVARALGFEPMLVPKAYVPSVRALLDDLQRPESDQPERGRFA
jgi:DNA-binding XRE family transcriptional regulator